MSMPGRFVRTTDNEINDFISKQRNKNTLKKKTEIKTPVHFRVTGRNRDSESILPKELSEILSNFKVCVRKVDGGEFEPSTLISIISSVLVAVTCFSWDDRSFLNIEQRRHSIFSLI